MVDKLFLIIILGLTTLVLGCAGVEPTSPTQSQPILTPVPTLKPNSASTPVAPKDTASQVATGGPGFTPNLASLADTPWPMFRHDLTHTGRSSLPAPISPRRNGAPRYLVLSRLKHSELTGPSIEGHTTENYTH